MDLKIELRKLYALHEACRSLDHGVRDARSAWRSFAPSRFVYAYFTFDSIYSYDWALSLAEGEPLPWRSDDSGRHLREEEQIKAFVHYLSRELGLGIGDIYRQEFSKLVLAFGISNPGKELGAIELVNADKTLRKLAKPMACLVGKLQNGQVAASDMCSNLIHVLRFVYLVRCNVFHGTKTYVEMCDVGQQRRLLIYAALLIATNCLLFQVPALANIGWNEVSVDFTDHTAQPDAAGDARQAARP